MMKIVYSPKKNEFIVEEGSFNLGYLGCYPKDKIRVRFDLEYFNEDNFNNHIKKGMNPDQIAEGLTKYYNERQLELEKAQKEINDCFLANIFEDIINCCYPFWEETEDSLTQFIIKDKMPDSDRSQWEDLIFSSEVIEKVQNTISAFYEEANDGTDQKPDMEAVINEAFPMIDLSKLVSAIYPEYLTLEDGNIIFQCSSNDCGKMLICGAYAEILKDNSFYDWHNH